MTTQKLFKRRVRERMAKTGESYTAARRHVAPVRDRLVSEPLGRAEPTRTEPTDATALAGAIELASDERIRDMTGKSWEAWLSLLDGWGARERKRGETVDFLMADLAVPGWWAQAIATGYERTRGLRLKHQQADGFTIYASKTVGVPIDALFDAFVDEAMRAGWLRDGSMTLRSSQPRKVARYDWGDGPTRVSVTFDAKGPDKATAFVAHERLADPAAAESAKAAWKSRLASLKAFLGSTDV